MKTHLKKLNLRYSLTREKILNTLDNKSNYIVGFSAISWPKKTKQNKTGIKQKEKKKKLRKKMIVTKILKTETMFLADFHIGELSSYSESSF